jgi:hypothetical protein
VKFTLTVLCIHVALHGGANDDGLRKACSEPNAPATDVAFQSVQLISV